MLYKGFKFGMLLQFAIGPVCIFIFQMASLKGFYNAETGVLGVALIDGIFIIVAILGIASIIDRKNIKVCLKIFGSSILFIFGFSTVLSQFNISLLPSLSINNLSNPNNVFTRAIILTTSNPLTIIFWAGVFSTKVAEENMKRKEIYLFGLGALLSTILFLNLIALVGSFAKAFFSPNVIQILNTIVGFLLIYFSIRMFLKNHKSF
ncbi:LysE family transporter [Desulfosporosinus sp. OT]|uniref:LysE family translocator n=1 Tax=Desulfosporosinus sp. OT TaxID=913865 RepID=UPI0002239B5F|nr:LysE family transporter [Desulfosporosinus sp. OT]EGW38750.1 lysE type translocator family protein [Desulfosporosinus sp. OT]